MNWIKTNTFIAIIAVLLSGSFAFFMTDDSAQAANACTSQYAAWVKASRPASGGTKTTLDSCIKGVARTWDSTPSGWCTDAQLEKTAGKSKDEKRLACINWYAVGFFNGKDACDAKDKNNDATCLEGAKSRTQYAVEYQENKPDSSSDSSSSDSSSSNSSDESGSGGGSTNAGGRTADTTTPSKWQGEKVGVDTINAQNSTISKNDIKDAGIITNLTAENIVSRTLNAVYSIVAVIAVIAIVGAGIMIITSDGDAQKVATGRKAIIYASVGLVITASAFIITGIIQGIAAK